MKIQFEVTAVTLEEAKVQARREMEKLTGSELEPEVVLVEPDAVLREQTYADQVVSEIMTWRVHFEYRS